MKNISKIDETILKYLFDHPGATLPEICHALNIAQSTLVYHLEKMREAGLVQSRRGRSATLKTTDAIFRGRRGRVWRIRKELPYVQ